MRVLVSAASKHGATAQIADVIGEELRVRGVSVDVLEPDDVATLADYDGLVLGSAVYGGHWLDEAKRLVDRSSASIVGTPVWLFSSGPLGDPPKPDMEHVVDVSEIVTTARAKDHHIFGGFLDADCLGFGEKALAWALRAPQGDFRDWTAVRHWAQSIAEQLHPVPAR
jgi:menaquinone-dependent protoporphyrinogen oxidase